MAIHVSSHPLGALLLSCQEYSQLASGSRVTKKGRKSGFSYFRQNTAPNSMPYHTVCLFGYLYDPLGRYIALFEACDTPFDLLGAAFGNTTPDMEYLVRGVSISSRLPYSMYRYGKLSGFFDRIKTLVTDWEFGEAYHSHDKRHQENEVFHQNCFGNVQGIPDAHLLRQSLYSAISSVPDGIRVDTVTHDWRYMSTSSWPAQVVGLLDSAGITGVFNDPSSSPYPADAYHQVTYTNLNIVENNGVISKIEYDYHLVRSVIGTWVYDIHFDYHVVWTHYRTQIAPVPLNVSFLVRNVFRYHRDVDWTCVGCYVEFFTPGKGYPLSPVLIPISSFVGGYSLDHLSDGWDGGWATFGLNSYSSEVDNVFHLLGYIPSSDSYYVSNDHSALRYAAMTTKLMPDVQVCSFFAANAAIEDHFEFLEANHIEAALELRDIFGLVSLPALFNAVGKLRLKVASLVSLIEILADSTLVYQFAIAPSVRDALDISLRARAFSSKHTNQTFLFGKQTIRGKVTTDIPDDLCAPFFGAKVITRVKMRLGINHLPIIFAAMPLDAAGLLPSLSRIWDLFPFSFVVDWFTGIGSSADILDSSLRLMALDIEYTVVSHNIVWNVSDDLISDHHISVQPGEGLASESTIGYNTYARYTLWHAPIVGPTRLPLFQTGIPNWATAGALMWKLR